MALLRARLDITIQGIVQDAVISFRTPDGTYSYNFTLNPSDPVFAGVGVTPQGIAEIIKRDIELDDPGGYYTYVWSDNVVSIIALSTGTFFDFDPTSSSDFLISFNSYFLEEPDPNNPDPNECFVSVISVSVTDATNNNTFDGGFTVNATTDISHTLEYAIERETTVPTTVPFPLVTTVWQASPTFSNLRVGTYKVLVRNDDGTCERFVNVTIGVAANTFTASATFTATCPSPLQGSRKVTKTFTSTISFAHALQVATALAKQEAENTLVCNVPQTIFQDLVNETYVEGRTIGYSVKRTEFVGEFTFTPDSYAQLDEQLVAFKEGKPWLFERGNGFNIFFDAKQAAEVTVLLNGADNGEQFWEKLLQSIHVNSSQPNWQITALTRDADGSIIQLTDIRPNELRYRKDMWHAPFKRDLNTPPELLEDGQVAITHGKHIRDQVIEITARTTDTSKWFLKALHVMFEKVSMWGSRKRDAAGTPLTMFLITEDTMDFSFYHIGNGQVSVQWAAGTGEETFVVGQPSSTNYNNLEGAKNVRATFLDGLSITEVGADTGQMITSVDATLLRKLERFIFPDNEITGLVGIGEWVQNNNVYIDLRDNRLEAADSNALLDDILVKNASIFRDQIRVVNLLGQFADDNTPARVEQLESFGISVLIDRGPTNLMEDPDNSGNDIKFKWVNNNISPVETEVWRSIEVDLPNPLDGTLLATLANGVAVYTDTDFSVGGTYYYYLRAKAKKNFSRFVKLRVDVGEYTTEYTTDFNS